MTLGFDISLGQYDQTVSGGGTPAFDPSAILTSVVKTWFNWPRVENITGGYLISTMGADDKTRLTKRTASTETVEVYTHSNADDHNDGAGIWLSDGNYLKMVTGHDASYMMMSKTTTPNDLSTLSTAVDVSSQIGATTYSYVQLIELEGMGTPTIFLIGRRNISGAHKNTYYSTSTDGGATWSAYTDLVVYTNNRPYTITKKTSSTRFEITTTDAHPDQITTNNIYHFYCDEGTFKSTDDTTLTLPIEPITDLIPIYTNTGDRCWNWDIQDYSGTLYVLFQKTTAATSRIFYCWAKWNGTSWDVERFAAAGGALYVDQSYYGGGCVLDPQNSDIVYASCEIDGVHQIFQYQRLSTNTWGKTQLTFGTEKCIRPMVTDATRKILYFQGTYTTYLNHDMDLMESDLPTITGVAIQRVFDKVVDLDVADAASLSLSGSDVISITDAEMGDVYAMINTGITYDATNTVANGNPAFVWPDTSNDTFLRTTGGFTAQWGVLVMAYGDGTDTTFATYNGIISTTGAFNRVMGDSGLDTLYSVNVSLNTLRINGAAASSTILPLPLSVVEFRDGDRIGGPLTFTAIGIGKDTASGRGWNGVWTRLVATEEQPSDATIANEIAFISADWGIT